MKPENNGQNPTQTKDQMDSQVDSQLDAKIAANADTLYRESYRKLCMDNDRVFGVLLGLQWVGAIVVSLVVSPRTWIGEQDLVHAHVVAAALLGGLLSSLPMYLNWKKPGGTLNRYVNVVAQGLYSALFIHLSGGRIETHFHVFGSLAFFAFYRDIRVLLTGTVVVAVDHLIRGVWFPQSAFGIFTGADWRWVEHAGWVVFEDFFLAYSCVRGLAEMKVVARKRAEVMAQHERAELIVELRTGELKAERNELHKRNETIETIYANVRSGFLMIDAAGIVQEGFTESCRTLLRSDIAAGMPLTAALGLNERHQSHFMVKIEQVFEDILPESMSVEEIPPKHRIGERFVRLEGAVVRNAEGGVRGVLFTISDITELQRQEQANLANQALILILQQKAAFARFLEDSRAMLEDCRRAASADDQQRMRFLMHSLKGNSSIFGLEEVAHTIHVIEDKEAISATDAEEVETGLKGFIEKHGRVLGISYDRLDEEVYPVSQRDVGMLGRAVASAGSAQRAADALRDWAVQLKRKSVNELVGPIAKMGEGVAERLGKDVKIDVLQPESRVDAELLRPVIQNLSHLVRNSIGHGIEMPDARGSKSKRGQVTVSIRAENGEWRLEIADDGRGIDAERVAQVAVERGHVTTEQAARMPASEKLMLIFKDGLSTAESVSYLSGRGVGMSAVAEAIRCVGGTIEVASEAGRGTTFLIRVPMDPTEADRALGMEPGASAAAAAAPMLRVA